MQLICLHQQLMILKNYIINNKWGNYEVKEVFIYIIIIDIFRFNF